MQQRLQLYPRLASHWPDSFHCRLSFTATSISKWTYWYVLRMQYQCLSTRLAAWMSLSRWWHWDLAWKVVSRLVRKTTRVSRLRPWQWQRPKPRPSNIRTSVDQAGKCSGTESCHLGLWRGAVMHGIPKHGNLRKRGRMIWYPPSPACQQREALPGHPPATNFKWTLSVHLDYTHHHVIPSPWQILDIDD